MFQIILSLLVIFNVCQALPVAQKVGEKEEVASKEVNIPIDEAKEFKYELNRDHELQGSINGGQSGWALEQIAHGAKPQEVVSGSIVRRKRQTGVEAVQAPSDAQGMDTLRDVISKTARPNHCINFWTQFLSGTKIKSIYENIVQNTKLLDLSAK